MTADDEWLQVESLDLDAQGERYARLFAQAADIAHVRQRRDVGTDASTAL